MHNLEIYNLHKNQPLSISNLIKFGTAFLCSNNISNGKNEIEWFLQELYGCDKIKLNDVRVDINKHNLSIEFLLQRIKKIPFQHIIKKGSFYGRDFKVNRNVLIPRPETEILIDIIKTEKFNKLLDIGTGSGCIAATIALEKISNSVDAIDIDNKCIDIAKYNAEKLNADNINFFKCDILKDFPNNKYDAIVSNPPYISKLEFEKLDKEVMEHEPLKSLTENADGLIFYKRFSNIMHHLLKHNGIAVFELSHFFKKDDILNIFNNFSNVKFFNDLNNDCRAIKIVNT